MNRLSRACFLLLVPPLLSACLPQAAKPDIWTTRYRQVAQNKDLRIHSFDEKSTPTLIIQGYGGQSVSWELQELHSQEVLDSQIAHIAESGYWWKSYPDLDSGDYIILLSVNGGLMQSTSFSVNKLVPD